MEIIQCEAPCEVYSFSWEIVIVVGTRLEFYDYHGRLTHTEHITADGISFIAYDPVQNRVLFTDSNDETGLSSIFSYEIVTRKIECLIRNTICISSLAFDPATELLFWVENLRRLYSISLKPGINSEKHLILTDDESNYIETIAVDSCGGFIYWISLNSCCIRRVRFDGSEEEVILDHTVYGRFSLDQQTQTMYWDEIGCFKCSDLNGKNIKTIRVKPEKLMQNKLLTTSKDSLYFVCGFEFEFERYIRKLPKNPQSDIYVKSKLFIKHEEHIWAIAANYKLQDLTRGLQSCEALKSLLPNGNDSLNDPTEISHVCVQLGCGHDYCECTQGYSDEESDDSVCENCCDDDNCSQSDDSSDNNDDNSDNSDDSSEERDKEQTKCSQISALHCRRRLEVLAAFVWIISLVFGEVLSIYLFIQLVYSRFWWMGILYGVWFINDIEICSRGGRPSEWVQNWKWWRYLCDYFPIKLVKTVDLDPSRNYIFACFPHGVISVAAFRSLYTNAKSFNELFPGITCRIVIRGGNFLVPFFRDFALALGMCSSTEQSLLHLLDAKKYKGNCVCLLIGDAAEALHEHPKEYKVNLKEKGYIRVAMKSGADLVPILSFGVTGLYRPPNNPENSLLHRFQEKVRQYTGISPIFPMRALVIAVVGEPMEVKRNLEPTNEEIDAVHAEFTERLKTLFETEKVKYLKFHEEAKLVITSE